MKEILEYLFNHHTLSKSQAKAIMIEIAQNKFNAAEVTAFVTIFLMRNITLPELQGFREALLQMAVPVKLMPMMRLTLWEQVAMEKYHKHFYISEFCCCWCRTKVIKHGNYGASTLTGSSNVLEQTGHVFKNLGRTAKELDQSNICFLHAPYFHPCPSIRRRIEKVTRTKNIFNLLGPLVNPAKPRFSVIGVYNLEIARIYQYLLQKMSVNL